MGDTESLGVCTDAQMQNFGKWWKAVENGENG